ncbi:heptaprenyl diphosphate synthase component 1 [Alicyclobacillus sp. ALC3]|uniref:heptaprenyl diphosphate synthase component 1 n=1 Tax=Alicyclobacillus sp. ALC3 TaxID=2796143 RepID=UPI0023793C89|nr:heptaprenyl diphosphate synthase component 1 [Alicyclobacillus sp. ALC3]WDL97136.1 heptaprenyl diphosphate synthase component 1 [Alicyclobacillus sp. ALC3]
MAWRQSDGMSEAQRLHFDDVNASLQQYMHHPFLAANQIQQAASRFHFGVSRAILEAAGVPLAEAKAVVEALLLLAQGLSIHEDVNLVSERRRQLTVLAGDYDSSRYYWLLARVGRLDVVSRLSSAVCKINEAKVTLLQTSRLSMLPEHYMDLRETVEGELLYALARHFLPENVGEVDRLRPVVRAYVANEDFYRGGEHPHFSARQVFEWLSAAIVQFTGPVSFVLEPVASFVEEFFVPLRDRFESHTYLEGNRG